MMETINDETIKNRLKRVIVKELKIAPEDIADDAHIGNDLGIDSADLINVLYDIEDEFKIEISDEEVGEISIVQEMYNLVRSKIN